MDKSQKSTDTGIAKEEFIRVLKKVSRKITVKPPDHKKRLSKRKKSSQE